MRTCNAAIVTLALLLGVVVVAANSILVLADTCTAQLNYAANYSNGEIVVPMSATCSFAGGELYAVGSAVDSFGNTLGSANTVILTFT
jgi:hypothetical protein